VISIAQQFSRTPAGRYIADGPKSGEAFRNILLAPSLRNNAKVVVDLNGALGFGSSFLEEAFGGLVRQGFSADELKAKLQIESDLATYKNRIWKYIQDADRHEKSKPKATSVS
jgi:hypothetical protein